MISSAVWLTFFRKSLTNFNEIDTIGGDTGTHLYLFIQVPVHIDLLYACTSVKYCFYLRLVLSKTSFNVYSIAGMVQRFMSSKDENDAVSALTGFSLNHILDGLQLPTGRNLSNQLGISGIPTLNSAQIYNEKWKDDEGAIGADQGEDWEAEIDRELLDEDERNNTAVKSEAMSPGLQPKQKRTRIIKRLVERPKNVYELFPSFDKGKILDFTEILKGNTARKTRLGKRHYLGGHEGLGSLFLRPADK